jgi:DNA-binding IclR family transcriptional regulator
VECLESPEALRVMVKIGNRAPIATSAFGRAIAAWWSNDVRTRILGDAGEDPALRRILDQVKARGYAKSLGEISPSVNAVAAALGAHRDAPEAAIAVVGPIERMTPDRVDSYGKLVAQYAEETFL